MIVFFYKIKLGSLCVHTCILFTLVLIKFKVLKMVEKTVNSLESFEPEYASYIYITHTNV